MFRRLYSLKNIQSIYFWLIAWIVLFSTYFALLHMGGMSAISNAIAYYSQILADVTVGLCCFFAYRSALEPGTKRFLKLTLISVLIGLYADEMYNFIFHFLPIHPSGRTADLIWILPYTLFLVIQIFAWNGLIKENEKSVCSVKETWFTTLCFVQAPVIILITVILASFFKTTPNTFEGYLQIINTILEMLLFFITAVTLSRSKTRWLSCFSTGILLLITFNMTHRFSYIGGYFNKTFDVAWLICFVFIDFGFIYFIKDKDHIAKFHDQKSMYVLTSALLLLITSVLFFVFSLLEIFISNYVELVDLSELKDLLVNLPGMLIFSFMVSVFIGKIISSYTLRSIKNISNRVEFIQNNPSDVGHVKQPAYVISEIQKLDNFISHVVKNLYDANQAKSDFLMNMSHDLRTPVSGISSMSKFIYDKIPDEKTKALQKLVVESSDQLLDIIDQILGYYQLLHNHKNPSCEEINVNLLLQDIVSFMSAKSSEKNLQVHLNTGGLPLLCSGDRVMLHRMLLNIIANAVKFTESGHIKITANHDDTKCNIAIKIEDTGIGMDAAQLEMIFEPFYQIESPLTSKYKGIGLGLSHVKLVLEKLRGKISVNSTLGVGSVFEITIPV